MHVFDNVCQHLPRITFISIHSRMHTHASGADGLEHRERERERDREIERERERDSHMEWRQTGWIDTFTERLS